jgi:hypothetical protein
MFSPIQKITLDSLLFFCNRKLSLLQWSFGIFILRDLVTSGIFGMLEIDFARYQNVRKFGVLLILRDYFFVWFVCVIFSDPTSLNVIIVLNEVLLKLTGVDTQDMICDHWREEKSKLPRKSEVATNETILNPNPSGWWVDRHFKNLTTCLSLTENLRFGRRKQEEIARPSSRIRSFRRNWPKKQLSLSTATQSLVRVTSCLFSTSLIMCDNWFWSLGPYWLTTQSPRVGSPFFPPFSSRNS